MKTIIIDCNNVMHKDTKLKKLFFKDKKSAQLSLIEMVKSRFTSGTKLIFVFDGYNELNINNAEFSNTGSADELIREKIEKFSDYTKLKVVSSDREITVFASVCGAEVQKSEDFLKDLQRNNSITKDRNINQNYLYDEKEKPERLSRKELNELRKHFS